jgi:hypothetical protein
MQVHYESHLLVKLNCILIGIDGKESATYANLIYAIRNSDRVLHECGAKVPPFESRLYSEPADLEGGNLLDGDIFLNEPLPNRNMQGDRVG